MKYKQRLEWKEQDPRGMNLAWMHWVFFNFLIKFLIKFFNCLAVKLNDMKFL